MYLAFPAGVVVEFFFVAVVKRVILIATSIGAVPHARSTERT